VAAVTLLSIWVREYSYRVDSAPAVSQENQEEANI
jgi:hypothetical protein